MPIAFETNWANRFLLKNSQTAPNPQFVEHASSSGKGKHIVTNEEFEELERELESSSRIQLPPIRRCIVTESRLTFGPFQMNSPGDLSFCIVSPNAFQAEHLILSNESASGFLLINLEVNGYKRDLGYSNGMPLEPFSVAFWEKMLARGCEPSELPAVFQFKLPTIDSTSSGIRMVVRTKGDSGQSFSGFWLGKAVRYI